MKLGGLVEDYEAHKTAKYFLDRRSYKDFTADFQFDFEPLPKVFPVIDIAQILPEVAPNNCL